MKYLFPRAAVSAALLTIHAASALAADAPTPADAAAQQLQREQERERLQREQLQPAPDVRLLPNAAAAPSAEPLESPGDLPCFPIRELQLEGEMADFFVFSLQAVPEREAWGARPACLGARGINAVLQRVQNALVARGYVTTRVLAQPQDLKSGVLRLTVVPGRVRAIRLDDPSRRASAGNALPTAPGRLLDLRDIEQGLENFKRLPSVEADIQIAPGERPGESDLLVAWKQGRVARLTASVDDAGSQATGKYQGGLTLSVDNGITLNDLFYVTLNHDLGGGDENGRKGTHGGVLHYSLPMGYWLLGATLSRSTYRQSVAGLSQTYVYSGENDSNELRLSRLVYRDAVRKTSLSLSGWQRSSRNYIDDTEVQVQHRRTAGWELGANHREFINAATLDLNLAYRRGTGAKGALAAPEEAFGEGTSRPGIVKADAQLGVPFQAAGQRLRYSAAWRAQWNRSPLVPQDRFSLGNRYTVRGFDGESTLSAERGWLIRNDLGWALGASGTEAYAGVDHGEVGGPTASRLIGRQLTGAALGLRGAWQSLGYDVFVGKPLSRPSGFETARVTAGFSLNWTY